MDDAKRAVDAAHWDLPWGADADHLKTLEDIPPFVQAGYTFFTVDPGDYVDNAAHVSAQLGQLPNTDDLPSLLDDFHAREVLHVTFGSALAQFGTEIKSSLEKHAHAYQLGLETHFRKHLELLK